MADLDSTVHHEGDVFAWDRIKTTHRVGSIGKVKFVRKGSEDYTGIFQGADYGLLRFSNPVEASKKQALIPSFGLKFLRDKVDSANVLNQIKHTDGQNGDWNYFSNDFYNHIGTPKDLDKKVLFTYLATESKYVLYNGLSNWAKYEQDGGEVTEPKFPF